MRGRQMAAPGVENPTEKVQNHQTAVRPVAVVLKLKPPTESPGRLVKNKDGSPYSQLRIQQIWL